MLRGASATAAGANLIPFPVGISVGSLGAGLIMNRTGRYYRLGLGAMFTFNLGTSLFCTFTLHTPSWPQVLYLFFFGTGYGASLTVGLLALIAAVKHSEQATTTSSSYLFRATGGTIGAAVGSAAFQTSLRSQLLGKLGDGEEAKEVIRRVLNDFAEVAKLPQQWRGDVTEAYMHALRMVFIIGFALGSLGLLTTAAMRENKLHKTLNRK